MFARNLNLEAGGINDNHTRLMIAIGEAIRVHTSRSPMSEEDIIGVLGFTLGCGIARAAKTRNDRRLFREMAVANVDSGLQAMIADTASNSLILPEGMQ